MAVAILHTIDNNGSHTLTNYYADSLVISHEANDDLELLFRDSIMSRDVDSRRSITLSGRVQETFVADAGRATLDEAVARLVSGLLTQLTEARAEADRAKGRLAREGEAKGVKLAAEQLLNTLDALDSEAYEALIGEHFDRGL